MGAVLETNVLNNKETENNVKVKNQQKKKLY